MQFTDTVLSKCSKEFLYELTPRLEHLLDVRHNVFYSELYDYGYGVIPKHLIIDNGDYDIESEAGMYCNEILPVLFKYSRCFDNLEDSPSLDFCVDLCKECRLFAWSRDMEVEESLYKEDEFILHNGLLYNKDVLDSINKRFLAEITPAMKRVLETHDIVYCKFSEGEFPESLAVADINLSDELYDTVYSITDKYVMNEYNDKIPFIGTNYIDWYHRVFCKRMEE